MRIVTSSPSRWSIGASLIICLQACGGATAAPQAVPPQPAASAGAPPPEAPSAASSATAPASPPQASSAHDPLDTSVTVSAAILAVVESKDRSEEDRKLDQGRHAGELLAFLGAAPGQRIGEIGSYQGYMAELMARAVAPGGKVYAQDPAGINKLTRKEWAARKASPALKNVVRVERPFDDPFPPTVKDLDAVVSGLFYHDMVWLGVDRPKMNAAILRALKPGGVYFVYDHSARDGTATEDCKTLHRIEERIVRSEIESAGFKLAASAHFLRHPEDKRDWNASDEAPKELRGTSDRFVLKFVKP
jgi:predicted methyltransferase